MTSRFSFRCVSIACLVLLALFACGGAGFAWAGGAGAESAGSAASGDSQPADSQGPPDQGLVPQAADNTPPGDDLEALEQKAFQAAVESVAPSVVRIETVGGLERIHEVLFGTGPTTGLIVDGQGYVVSSAFNFLNRPSSILVRLPDGTRKPADLVATDHSRMLVLLRIHVDSPLPVPPLAPQQELRVGQWTVAVGRTFEAERPNMTVGILSALGRVWGKAIQTDAIVSPNNYGGPLVDIRGRVLGVIVPLAPQSADEVAGVEWYDSGIGFAVPAEHIQQILPRLKKGEDLYPGLIGIAFGGSLETGAATIAACHPNSPAAKAGLKVGDKIVEIDGHRIRRAVEVKCEISRRYAGDKLRLVVLRGQQRIAREVELIAKLEPYEHAFLGILPLRVADDKPGVTVRYAYPGSPAAEAGIAAGEAIVSLAGKPIRGPGELREQLSGLKPEKEVELEIRRAEQARKVTLKLGRLPEDLPPAELPPARPSLKVFEGERPQVGAVSLKIPELKNDVWAYVSENYRPDVPHGVVVWLHAPGGFDQRELLARWQPLCDRYDLILLAPRAADPQRWEPTELDLVDKLLDKVDSTYHVDRTRVVVHGHEGGGTMAYLAAFRNREMIRAVAAVDALPLGRPPDNDPLHRLAVYTTTAKKSGNAGRLEQALERLREMKIPVAVKDLGQQPRYLTADELAELACWIDMLDRI
jgi:serine protease Do